MVYGFLSVFKKCSIFLKIWNGYNNTIAKPFHYIVNSFTVRFTLHLIVIWYNFLVFWYNSFCVLRCMTFKCY